ncbi:transposable element Tc1 transposase [Trichonephila clavipes]|nr:transposable element Tc1 transposase [Trichonephila clavipes]
MIAKNELRRRRSHQQLTESNRDHAIGLRKGGFSFRDMAERFCQNISTAHDCWEQWSRDGTASRRPGYRQAIWYYWERRPPYSAYAHRSRKKFELELYHSTKTLLEIGYFKEHLITSCNVACIPLTPSHCHLRCQWCQAKAHWRAEWRSVVFADEIRFQTVCNLDTLDLSPGVMV